MGSLLTGVACASVSTCFAVGTGSTILRTTNADNPVASTWTSQPNPLSGTSDNLAGVACPSPTTCIAVGFTGDSTAILRTTKANDPVASTWTIQRKVYTTNLNYLDGVACPDSKACYAVGSLGIILSTTNADSPGEPGWDYTNETVTQHGVACLDSKTCYSVGAFGSILATTNGGSRWDGQGVSHTNLFGVACRNTTVPNVIPSYCFAVGDSHTILRSLDEGQWGVGGP